MFWRAPVGSLNVFQCSILCVVWVYSELGYNYKEWSDIRTALSSNSCWPEGILSCDYQAVSFRTLRRTIKASTYNLRIWKMRCGAAVGKQHKIACQGFYRKRPFNPTHCQKGWLNFPGLFLHLPSRCPLKWKLHLTVFMSPFLDDAVWCWVTLHCYYGVEGSQEPSESNGKAADPHKMP